MKARGIALTLCLAFGLLSPAALGSTLLFDYGGIVRACPATSNPPCGDTLFPDDLVTGLLEADISHLGGAGGKITYHQFLGFTIAVGDFLVVDTSNSDLVNGGIEVDANGNVLGGFLVFEGDALMTGQTMRLSLNMGSSFWAATIDVGGDQVLIANGVGKLAPVPVPGALVLFATALAGLVGLRRRL